jgi:MarR family transcriptional regulator, lower aerobic nicotinate degradation pathway regulator
MKKHGIELSEMYSQPGYLIRRAHQAATAAFAAATSDLDLTPVQFSALIAIKDNPDIDATRVSEIISFDRTTIGHVLARLETKRLIVRQSGTLDKRTKTIRLTLTGESLIRKVSQRVEEIGDIILKPFNPGERTALLTLLAKFCTRPVDERAEQPLAAARRKHPA